MRAVAGATPREIDGGARRPRRAAPRADIQGLRAVAVLLVVLGHAGMPMLAGGYVGVDVFFVISGFLITGWLLRRATERRSVPFGEFYGARARRILPAATLTLVATAVACTYLLNYVRAAAALRDEVWAAVFAANVHFSQVNANYFAADDPPSPIQHFWTLAVEEQFYLLWPLLLAGLMLLSGRRSAGRGPPRTRGLTVLVAAGVVASLAWSIHVTSSDPQAAYFSATARAWELGIGALVAVALADIARIPVWIRALADLGRPRGHPAGRDRIRRRHGVPGVCRAAACALGRPGHRGRGTRGSATRRAGRPRPGPDAPGRGSFLLPVSLALAGAGDRPGLRRPRPAAGREPRADRRSVSAEPRNLLAVRESAEARAAPAADSIRARPVAEHHCGRRAGDRAGFGIADPAAGSRCAARRRGQRRERSWTRQICPRASTGRVLRRA